MRTKVLLITYDFFPDNSPNTYRWLSVLREWKSRDVEIHVLCFHKSFCNVYEEYEGIQIYRTGKSLFEKIKNKIFVISEKAILISESQNQEIIKEGLLRKIYNITWKKLYFPDFAFSWQTSAIKSAEEIIKIQNIRNVITVSWPFSDHVIGSKLKKTFPYINWIADTIDPFYLSKAVNNHHLYHSLNYKYEKKILSDADVMTVLTDKLKNKYSSLYPRLMDKIVVNHNVFVPYEIIHSVVDSSITKLVFVGTLTPITRSPLNLLRIFDNLLKNNKNKLELEMHFYGDYKQCWSVFKNFEHLLGKHIFLNGIVPRERIASILNDASVLVNIGNNNEYQEPSKILEYIYLGKPVLNVCSIVDDSSLELLSKYDLNYNVFVDDINDMQKEEELLSFISKKYSINQEQINSILREYLLPEVENRYFKLLL